MAQEPKQILVISSAHTGYRRAGMAFQNGKNVFDSSRITESQLAMLKQDPRLAVSVDEKQAPTGSGGDSSGVVGKGDVSKPDTVVAAIKLLDPENKDLFTQGGKPTTEALSELMGRAVTATERDSAWEAVQESDTLTDEPAGE